MAKSRKSQSATCFTKS